MLALSLSSGLLFADDLGATLAISGGGLAGGGLMCLAVDFPDEDTSSIVGCVLIASGAVSLLAGVLLMATADGIAKTNTNSPFQYVKFCTNGKDKNLSVKFDL